MNRPPIEEFINTQLGGQTEQIKDLKKYSEEMYNLQQQMINAAKDNTVVSPDIVNRLTELTDKFKQVTAAINDSKFRLADLAIDASNAFTNIAQSMKDVNVNEIKDGFTDLHNKIQELSQMQFELNNDNVSEYTNKVSEVINGLSTMKQFVNDLNQQGLNLNFDASAVISQLDDLTSHYNDVSDSAVDFAKRLSEIAASTESITAAFNKTSLAFDSVKKSADGVSSGAKNTQKTLTELFAALDGNTTAQNSMNDMSKQIDELKKSIADLQAETVNPQNLMGDAAKATALTQQVSAQMAGVQQLFDELMNQSGNLSLKATENLSQNIQKLMDNASDSINGTVSMITAINDQLPQEIMNKLNEAAQSSSSSSTDVLLSKIRADTDRITGAASSTDMSYLAQTAHTSYANAAGGIGASAANAYQSSQMLLDMSSGFNFLNNRAFKDIATESTALARTGNEYKKAQSSFNEAFSKYENASTPQEKEQAKKAVDEATKQLMQVQKVMNEQAKKIGRSFKTFTPDDLARLGKEGEQLTKFVKDVLERTSKSAGDLHTLSKTLNLDVDEKTLKSLIEDKKAMNEFGEEIQKTEKKANDLAKTLKDGVGGAIGSLKSAWSSVTGILGKLGLGIGALGPFAVGYKAYEMHAEQGRARYKTMGVDASVGVTDMATSAANAQQRLMQGNDIYAMSGGMINREFLNESYKSAMQNVGGHYGSSPEQAMSEVNELVGKTALMQQVYGIDQGTMNDMYQTYFKDMKMSANDAAGAIAQVTETARTAGIPVSKYLKMINGLAQNFMKIGIEGDSANTVMGNVLARGARADVAQEVASEAGNTLGKMAGDKNWVAYTSSVMGMNPFEGLARAAYTHEANGDPRAGWANDIIKMADMRVNTMAGAAGNDPNVKRMIVTDTFKEMGFSQRSASMLTSSYMQGNIKQFEDLFNKESKKLDNPNASLEEVNKKLTEQLQAMTGQLAGSDKLRAQLEAALYKNADKIGNVVDDLLKQIGPLILKLQSVMMTLGYLLISGIGNLINYIKNYNPPQWLSDLVSSVKNFAMNNPITAAAIGSVGAVATVAGVSYAKNKAVSGVKQGGSAVAKYGKDIIKTGLKSKAGAVALGTLAVYGAYSYLNPAKAEMSSRNPNDSTQPQNEKNNNIGTGLLATSSIAGGAALTYGAYSTYKNRQVTPTTGPNPNPPASAQTATSSQVKSSQTNKDIKGLRDAYNKQTGLLRQQMTNLQLEARASSTKTSLATQKSEAAIQKSIRRNELKQQKMAQRAQSMLNANNKNVNAQAKAGRDLTQKASNISSKNSKELSNQAAKNAKSFLERFSGLKNAVGKVGSSILSFLGKRILPAIGLFSDSILHWIKGDAVAGDIGASIVDNAIPTATGVLGAMAAGAAVGSIVPGAGTLVGAGVGLVGGILGAWGGNKLINENETVKAGREKIKSSFGWDEESLNKDRINKYGADYLLNIEETSLLGDTESDYYKQLQGLSQNGNNPEQVTQENSITEANISTTEDESFVDIINGTWDKNKNRLQGLGYSEDQIKTADMIFHSDDMLQDASKFGITSGNLSENLSKSTEDEAKESNEKNTASEKADDSRKKAADSSAKKIVTQAQKEEELSKVRNKSLVEFMKLEQELIGNFQASVSVEHGNLWKKSHEIEEVLKLINHNIIESGKAVASISSGGSSGGFSAGGNKNTLRMGQDALEEAKTKDPELAKQIEEKAKKYKLDPRLFALLVKNESGFNKDAVSSAGAIGLTQLMPDTAAELGVDVSTIDGQLEGGAKYLAKQMERFGGDWAKAVAAYNAGPGAVINAVKEGRQNWHRSLVSNETKNYLKKFGLATGDINSSNFNLVAPDAAMDAGTGQIRWQSQFENGGSDSWCTSAAYGMLYNSLHGTTHDVNYIHDNIWNGNSNHVDNILTHLGLEGTTYTGSKQRAIEGLHDSLKRGTPTYLYYYHDKHSKLNSGTGSHAVIIQADGKGGFTYYNPAANSAEKGIGHISLKELEESVGSGTSVLVPEQFNSKYQGSGINSASQLDFQEADIIKPPDYTSSTQYSIKGQGIGNDLINSVVSAIDTTKSQEEQINQAVTASNGQIKAEDLKKEVESSGKSVQDAVKSLQNKYRPPAQTSTYTNDVTAGISGDAWLQTKLIHIGQIYGDYSTDVHRGMLGSSEGLMGLMDSMYQAPVSQHVGQWQKAMQMVRGVTMGSGSHRSARQRLDLSNAKGLYRMGAEETGEYWRTQGVNQKSLEAQVEQIKKAEEKAKETTSKVASEKATSTEEAAAKITAEEKKQETAAKAVAESKDASKVNTEEMQAQAEKDLENKKIDVDVIINGQLDNFIDEFERKITSFIEGLGAKVETLNKYVKESSANNADTARAVVKALNSVPKE